MSDHLDRGKSLRIGVDTGGTFTDISLYDPATEELHVWKVSSTTADPSEAIADGVKDGLDAYGHDAGDVVYFGHGTTVATNALIQGRIARTGMITTAGFRDVIEIRRQMRPELYDLQMEKPEVLARRDRRHEVRERVNFDGSIRVPISEEEVREVIARLKDQKVEAIAIGFLFAYLMPEHEALVKRLVAEEMPEVFVCTSAEVAPEYREFERFSTTVVNAALGPVMQGYLDRLKPRLEAHGISPRPHLTQSNGGVISAQEAANFPVRTVLSGPAAGVAGALEIGRAAGIEDIITFDMGGTSSDVALIDKGRPQLATDAEVHGHPIKVPMLDIHAVGAGGGSIANVDGGGHLKVGPDSAGAVPGPVCYGKGNEQPTVTDANVVLQVLNPTHLLGGRMEIDQQKAKAAIARLADRLGLGVMETAQGIISVVTANMAKAIRVISVERGYDPRDYVLMAFGGAGPVHAARLARELEIRRVLVPRNPGILCSMGLLLTDLKAYFSAGRMTPLRPESAASVQNDFSGLQRQADDWFDREGIVAADRSVTRTADLRYHGQAFELSVDCPEGEVDERFLDELRSRFEAAHRQVYGYISSDEAISIIALRLVATGRVPKARLKIHPPATGPVSDAVIGSRYVWLPEAGSFVACPLYDRAKLAPGHVVPGPAIVEQMDSTTLVLPGQSATVDAVLNLLLEEND
ncbi:hydantoinase/oxoprolinase family protein [Neorhizobium lilium]|uniref:Hydantoinase/oxoprolinase family protein n=1 Tax=Neorhizobium lilium TaxID=2503024 RepID=A0A3S4UUL7_9HYPH|nr:hydantoinase/oxoprolinase family protein [Neorhizobium lilium]RWX81242.1 hydantoinase/oxoprolinase family protein [Neorhizobium lilium]